MELKEARKILEQVKKNPELLASNNYLEAVIETWKTPDIALKVGPNCNLSCVHCCESCSTERKGLPSPKLAERVMKEAIFCRLPSIVLTDGEPVREENRELLKIVARGSGKIPVSIFTNAVFAETYEKALDWMLFLKNSGFSPENNCHMRASAGRTYNVPLENYGNAALAYKNAFGKFLTPFSFEFLVLGMHEKRKDADYLTKLITEVDKRLAPVEKSDFKGVKDEDGWLYYYYPKKGEKESIRFALEACVPDGRARSIASVRRAYPEKPLRLEDISFALNESPNVVVDSQGNVSYGFSQSDAGVNYGNILKVPLINMLEKIYKDDLNVAFQFGGYRFMVYLARQVKPEFCPSYRSFFEEVTDKLYADAELVSGIREILKKENFVKSYKKYLAEVGIPKID